MRIRALRLAETGCFRDAVAIEGLSGGLDVLAGANELGKSTLLRALEALLFESYKTDKTTLKTTLQPYRGGAPMIEADIETAGSVWRLRKRFFQGKAAELRRTGSNELLRGSDAEQRLAELLAGAAGGHARLLWVGQQEGLSPVTPGESEAATIRSLLAREVAAVTSGRLAEVVRGAVATELAKLATPSNGRPKTGGPWKQALEESAALEASTAEARRALADAEGRLERLASARARRQDLADPFVRSRHTQETAAAVQALEAAREAGEKARIAEADWSRLEAARKTTADALARHTASTLERDRLAGEARAAADQIQRAAATLAQAARTAELGAATLAELQAGEQTARVRLERARRRSEIERAQRERTELAGRLTEIRALVAAAGSARAELASFTIDDRLMRRIETEGRSIATLEARLAAASTRVEIALDPAGAGRLTIDGSIVADGAELLATGPMTISIAGIGRIRLEPGTSGEIDELAGDLAAHRSTHRDLLERSGVSDEAGANELLAVRREVESGLMRTESRLAALAPEGESAIAARIAALDALASAAAPQEDQSIAELATHAAGIELERRAGERTAAAAAAALNDAQLQVRELEAGGRERERRIAELAAIAPGRDLADRLASALTAAEAAANEARRSLEAWRERLPSPEAAAALARRLDQAKASEARFAHDLNATEGEIGKLEATLERDKESDLASRLSELEGRLERARRRLARHEQAAAELMLIRDMFEAVRGDSRASTLAPVMAALEPYLHLVLPQARLDLDARFAAGGLDRQGLQEPIERLSGGTREQIAVLVRLGLARLFAQKGMPAPLILDDALVYSDDERIERAFEALRLAARHHQVIVFTCRTRTFAALGGTRLQLGPWSP